MRHVFNFAVIFLAFCSRGVAQPPHYFDFWQKGTLTVGKYDTIAGISVFPDSICQWTDSTKIEIWAGVDGFHQINDGMSAYYVGAAKRAGTFWLYSHAKVNLSCDSMMILGDNPDFTVIDPLSVQPTDNISVRSISSPQMMLQVNLLEGTSLDITMSDVRGIESFKQTISCPTGASEIDLDAGSLPAGCYWYVVRGNGWSKSGKAMKLP